MADDKTKVGKPDRDRINVGEDYEVHDWSKKFGVSEQELRRAVEKVGPTVKDIGRELKQDNPTQNA